MSALPILYSFRRCPYAMRARMAVWVSGTVCELREVKLAAKPAAMLETSPKGTVPVLVLPDGTVVDESLAIMRHVLAQNDPKGWLEGDDKDLVARIDGPFKHHLDRYKYHTRHGSDPVEHRTAALTILHDIDGRLADSANLCGDGLTLTDIATFPFIRQFANHDRAWFDAQQLPHLHRWLIQHLASNLFAAIMVRHNTWIPGDEPTIFPA